MQCMDCKNQADFTRITSTAMVLTYRDGELVREEEMEVGGEFEHIFCGECGSSDVQEAPKADRVLSFQQKEEANG